MQSQVFLCFKLNNNDFVQIEKVQRRERLLKLCGFEGVKLGWRRTTEKRSGQNRHHTSIMIDNQSKNFTDKEQATKNDFCKP